MAKTVQLLLTENVDNLGIIGDVVNVKLGYARNYLLPRQMATVPTDDAVQAVAERRVEAEKMVALHRKDRDALCQRLTDIEITMERSCNNQGVLYGSVTQEDIAGALNSLGYAVRPRDVRLPVAIKRLDSYEILLKFDADLESTIKLWVTSNRELDEDEREEMEFDNEGNLIEKPAKKGKAEEKSEPAASEG